MSRLKSKLMMMVLGALIGAAVAFSTTLVLKPIYRVQCLLEIKDGADGNAIVVKLLRHSLLKSVSEKLSSDEAFHGSKLDVERSLSAKQVAKGLIHLRCTGSEPLICERALELVLDEYMGSIIEHSAKEGEEETRLIMDRVSQHESTAREIEEERGSFMKKYSWLADSGDREDGIIAAYEMRGKARADKARELAKLEAEAAAAREKRDKVKTQLEKEEKHVVTELVKEINPDILSLNEELLEKQKRLSRFLVDSSDQHPMVKRLRKEIEGTKKMIEEKPKEVIIKQSVSVNPRYRRRESDLFRAESDVEKVEARMAKLREDIAQYERSEKEIPPDEWKRIVYLEKERSKNIEILGTLRDRLASIRSDNKNQDAAVIEFSVIDPPTSREVLPERWLIIAVGALIGLLLGAVLPSPAKRTGK